MRKVFLTGYLAAAFGLGGVALAEPLADFPSRAVNLVVPFAAGGPTEPLLRPFAEKLNQRWGQPIVIDNKPGANGIIGTHYVMRTPGDGYTWLYHITGMIQNALVSRDAKYDPFTDFKPVVLFGTQPLVLAVSSDSPYQTVDEVIDAAREPGAEFAYGSVGSGSTFHIYGELLASKIGVDLPHIAYKGMAPLLNDLIPGRLPVSFVPAPVAVRFGDAGTLRPLAVTGTERLRELPNVPTLAESGLDGFELLGWYGLFVPASTPDELVDRIADAANSVMADPDMVARLEELYITPTQRSPREIAEVMKSDHARWAELVERFEIRLD